LRKVSPRKAKILANQARIKKELIEEHGLYCMLNNHYASFVDNVHIIRQSYSEALQDNPYNIVLGCRHCHNIFDEAPIEEVMKLKGITPILERMKKMDELYYNRYVFRSVYNYCPNS